jgi:hypothetical protein
MEKLTIEAAYDYIYNLVGVADINIRAAQKVADEYGISFKFRPSGVGIYNGKITYPMALEYVENGEYKNLDEDDQYRFDRVLKEKTDQPDYKCFDYWCSSFC